MFKLSLNKLQKLRKKIAAGLAAMMLAAAPAFAQLVTVEGVGPDQESALDEAKRAATEEVVGIYLHSASLVENNVIISDDVYSKTAGFVSLKQILSQGRDQNGDYRVRAVFDVNTEPDSALTRQMELLVLLRDPRIAVIVLGPRDRYGNVTHEEISEIAMNNSLLELGFTHVVDTGTALMLNDSALLEALYNDERGRLGDLGLKGVDYFVLARAETSISQVEAYGRRSNMRTGRAALTARLVKADTGDLLGSFQVDGTGLDISDMMAERKALTAAGQKAGQKLAQSFNVAAQRVAKGVRVEVEGSADDVQAVAADLRLTPGVKNVTVREAAGGRGVIEVETSLSAEALYRAFRAVSHLGIILEGASGSGLKLTVI